MTYNAKDIYLERAKANQTFEEFPLAVQPNAVVITDSGSNLRTTPIATFLAGISGSGDSSSFTGSLLGTASNARTIDINESVIVHSHQGSVGILATTDVFLSATGAMDMEAATGDISMFPSSTVKVYGDLSVTGHVYSPVILSGSNSPTFAFLSATGWNPGDVHGFLGFNGKYSSSDNGFAESARIEGVKDASDGISGGALIFYTSDASFSVKERARIDSNGKFSVTGSVMEVAGNISCSVITASMINTISSSAVPLNQTTASAWMPILVNGVKFFMPLYQ